MPRVTTGRLPDGLVLLERGGVLAVDKPAGWLVIPGRGEGDQPSLREALEDALGRKVYVVHRLDRDTSGAMLFALDPRVHRALSMAFEQGRIRKRYLAIVKGEVADRLDLSKPLVPGRRGRMRPARPQEEGKAARTLVRPLEALRGATLVEAEPLTGRTHQIRVHLADAGHPLIVDHQYGDDAPLRGGDGAVVLSRTPLHCAGLEVPQLEDVPALALEARLPGDLERALALLRER